MSRLVAGLDLGSTAVKLLIADVADASGASGGTVREVQTLQRPTPWVAGPGGTTQLAADDLLAVVGELLSAAAERPEDEPIRAVAVAGMGETGVLLDDRGAVAAPAFAWFDPRGARQAASFPEQLRSQFAGRTGLPLGAQVSVAKIAYLRDEGLDLAGLRWLNLPEFIAMSLGGRPVVEHSLSSRTGLIDLDTGEPWPAMLAALGITPGFLPEQVPAGALLGRGDARLPAGVAGALITVAGHDHLVAAEAGSGSAGSAGSGLDTDRYHVSTGTAEVLLRVVDRPLGFDARARLAGRLINEVRHVVPGQHVLVAGVKSGLLLRRALQAAGIRDRAGRDELDAAVMALPYEGDLAEGAIEVGGARNDDGELRIAIRTDGATPAEIFGAVLRHSNTEIAALITAIDRELPSARSSILTGGWAGMAAVRRARARVLPRMATATHEQATAFGAALVAGRLLAEHSEQTDDTERRDRTEPTRSDRTAEREPIR